METAAVLATPAYQHFDKGIRARALGDQLSAIVGVTNLLKENPFPNLVNQVALRLADAFKDGNNKVRTCIARVLDDSSEHLSLIFSSEEVLKRIFVVSHSNDPVSKALTLEVLGKLAHLYVKTKKVHHLILESLTTEHDFEFECAVRAMTAFAQISSEFSAATVERIAVLLTSSEVAMERKILIVSTIGTMKADVKAANECFGLEKFLLQHSSNTNLVCTLLSGTTSLAKSTRYAIPMQVEILLDAAINADAYLGIRLAALSELIILAKYAHLWEDHHLKKLQELKAKVDQGPAMILNKYLRILIQISSRMRVNHAVFLQEILFELGYLFTSQQIAQRILSIQFACNIYIYHPDPALATKLVHAFTITAGSELRKSEAGRFYATLARFLCSPSVSQEYIQSLLGPLLESSLGHPHAKHVVQLLCRVADRLPALAPAIRHWTTQQLGSLSNAVIYTSDLREELVFLLLIPTVEVADTPDLVAVGSDWDRYTTARTAFRNGHWNNAALANLTAIDTASLSSVHKYWIEVLIKLAASQLTVFSVTSLQEQRDTLTFAHAKAVELVEFLPSSAFIFAKNYIEAQVTVSNALHSFICAIASITRFDSHFTDPASLYRVRTALQSFARALEKCDVAWTSLYRKAFTADASTLDSLTYVHTSIVIVLIGVKKLLKDENIRDVMMPNLQKETAISIGGRERLVWAKEQVGQLGPLSKAAFNTLIQVVEAAFTFRQSIPRYIFHQEYDFTIKLNVSSAVNGEMSVVQNQNVPIQIDGFIETNHPTKIESVIITSAIHYFTAYANCTSFTSNIKLNGETHFSTQLMLCFRQSCNMEFAVEFVDSQKRTWSTSVKSKVKVMINE